MSAASPAAHTRSRPSRPNYRQIHAKPLPLDTFPLPPLIPQNPLSLLQIAYVYLSHLIFPPCSHTSNSACGYFSRQTSSVHITDPVAIRLLWERGFFGKGSLSRSEPTWLDREKKRLGLMAKDTSEEYTQQRREERRRMKLERARKEREAIEEKLTEEKPDVSGGEVSGNMDLEKSVEDSEQGSAVINLESGREKALCGSLQDPTTPAIFTNKALADALEPLSLETKSESIAQDMTTPLHLLINDEEHLQLTSEEAFFLAYGLGVLKVFDDSTNLPISIPDLLTLFRSHSHCPPLLPSSLTSYDPFLPSYAAYHHFRSLGWVVRPGIKFAVDWLLYLRGPAFSHAEFAVVVLPAYRDGYWRETDNRRRETAKREKRDWWWLHCLQRVQAQVRKGLVICWVEIPVPDVMADSISTVSEVEAAKAKDLEAGGDLDIGKLLKHYKVRDMTIKRWIPNRSRD